MKQALFYNFSNKEFIGYWDGKAKKFNAGDKQYMEEWRARHYAKHLANGILIATGKENSTSPKFPDQMPDFLSLFNKACIVPEDQEQDQDESDLIEKQHEASLNIQKQSPSEKVPTVVDSKEPQTINAPESDDESFEGLNT